MELHADEPGMVGDFHDLGQPFVRRPARHDKAVLGKRTRIADIDLVAMAMALADFRSAIDFRHPTTGFEDRRIGAEPQRAAEIAAFLAHFDCIAARPFRHTRNNGMARGRNFRRTGVFETGEIARRFDNRHVQTVTNTEERNLTLTCKLYGFDLAT